jgi:hypothetical protein
MRLPQNSPIRSLIRTLMVTAPVLLVTCFPCSSPVAADTFISGFEGDLGSTLGVDWKIADALATTFVTDGVTEGTEALSITHNTSWTNAIFLDSGALLDIVASHDTFDVDVTIDTFDATWRQIYVIMQGTGLGWSQVEVNLDNTDLDYITTNVSLDLSDPVGDGSLNWKASAQQARADLNSGAQTDEWWQVFFIFQGEDITGATEINTIVDNVRFSGGPDADFNEDGYVDGQDSVIWQASFGLDTGGDADADSDTDGADFLIYQRQFTGPSPSFAAVPEPSTLVIFCAAWSVASMVTARRRVRASEGVS